MSCLRETRARQRLPAICQHPNLQDPVLRFQQSMEHLGGTAGPARDVDKAMNQAERYQFDAHAAFNAMRERYLEFLLETYSVHSEPLRSMLRTAWSTSQIGSLQLIAPLFVQGVFPYEKGPDLRDLGGEISAGPSSGLHPRTIKLLQNAGYDFRLHQHQARAAQAVAEGRTVILSAGTGSGKTESFLIPIIDRLFWDHEQGLDDLRQPGVRAVVIYPLNALVNNQVERLVDILKDQRDISFAYYTSRLPETWSRIRTRCESPESRYRQRVRSSIARPCAA